MYHAVCYAISTIAPFKLSMLPIARTMHAMMLCARLHIISFIRLCCLDMFIILGQLQIVIRFIMYCWNFLDQNDCILEVMQLHECILIIFMHIYC